MQDRKRREVITGDALFLSKVYQAFFAFTRVPREFFSTVSFCNSLASFDVAFS